MTSLLSKIYYLCNVRQYDNALEILHTTKEKLLSPDFLVLKGICIQLTSQEQYQLLDAETAFKEAITKEAITIDSRFVEAWIELGWFYLNVKDDAIHAISFFQMAIEISCEQITYTEGNLELYCEQITEAIIGKARCLIETFSIEASHDTFS